MFGTDYQPRSALDVECLSVAGAVLPLSSMMKSLGVILDQRLTFRDHANSVVEACHYNTRAIRYIRPLLSQSTALTLACSIVNSHLDYCNSLLNGAPASAIKTLQRAQNTATRFKQLWPLGLECVTANTALASSLSTHRAQDSSVDVQGKENLTAGVPEPSFGSAGIFMVHAVCYFTAVCHTRIKN